MTTTQALTKGQKSLLLILGGTALILFVRFGGWRVLGSSLRYILPIVVIAVFWKRIFRR